jgi:hypothetical protein
MKPNAVSTKIVKSPLTVLPTAKIVKHPDSEKIRKDLPIPPPDEETLKRLNDIAKQYPFSRHHKGRNNGLL